MSRSRPDATPSGPEAPSGSVDLTAVERFLACDPIAVVGVHRDTREFANSVYRRLRDAGHRLVPVHPEVEELEGDRCVPTIGDLVGITEEVGTVDAVLVMVAPERAAEIVEACVERGITHVWLHRGAGVGSVSQDAVRIARAAGLVVVEGACPMMFLEPVRGVHRVHRFLARRRFVRTS